MKKEQRKKISFVVFVMAVFFAGAALTVFHSDVWVMVLAGVLLLAASCFFVLDRGSDVKEPSPSEKASEILLADRMAELMRGNEKAEKGVYIAVKKQHEAMEAGMSMLETRLNELVKAQENAMKTLVLYNKENARQIALSERDEMERLCKELQNGFADLRAQLQDKEFLEEVSSPLVVATKQMGNRIYEEMHESNEAILSELGSITDSTEEMKSMLSELLQGDLLEKPANTADKSPQMPLEEISVSEPASEDTFADSGVDLSDPNKTLSADDIAALFASMGGASEPEAEGKPIEADEIQELVPEIESSEEEPMAEIEEPAPIEEPEPVSEPASEDAFADSGVDLSDPNRTLSADDIAALIASLGN